MGEMRMAGALLAVARWMANRPFTRSILWSLASKDFRIAELLALSADHRLPLDDLPRPVQGAPPRRWGEGELGVPTCRRCSGRMLRAAYASKSTSPSSVLESVLLRVGKGDFGDSTHSPFAVLDEERARAAAAASSARWKEGRPLGPLDGVVVAVKDEFDFQGLPTRGGCLYLDQPAPADAFLTRRLREEGAVLLGKTHATEWGLNPLGYSQHFDFPRNVYHSDRGAGGSSTGSAVAVGLGLCSLAVGSDGGGSIRIPSTLNGVFGLKPTFIRVGRTGDTWGSSTMAHIGPIGQSVEDLVDFLEVAAGVDPQDPSTLLAPDYPGVAGEWRRALGRGIRGARIGVLAKEMAEATSPIASACQEALRELEKDGATLVDVSVPLAEHAPGVGALIISSEATANISDEMVAHGPRVGDELGVVFGLMKNLGARDFLLASRTRAALRRQAAAALAPVDLLALPATARQAPPYGLSEGRRGIFAPGWIAAMTRFAFLANLTGLPAGIAPVGMNDGLPLALQLIGDAWDEASVIAAMAHLERLGLCEIQRPKGWRSSL
ncbi:MAG: amidase [Myxococcales bacterium]|nr:amidase [Myxococcales bacterium]